MSYQRRMFQELHSMSELEDIMDKAIANQVNFSLFIKLPDLQEPEIITNPPANLEKKLKYYKETYNDRLEHKYADGVKILGW